MQIRVTLEAGELLSFMRNGPQGIRYAAANALNDTAKYVQSREKAHVRSVFKLRPRGGEFIVRESAIIKPFASAKRDLTVTISVGQKPRILLAQFEQGEPKRPAPGRSAIVVPVKARPGFPQNVPPEYFVRSFRLRKSGHRTIGAKRTFVIPHRGIFQQQPGKAPPIMLYLFTHEGHLDRRLQFVATGLQAVSRFYAFFEREVSKAVQFRFEHYGERAFSTG